MSNDLNDIEMMLNKIDTQLFSNRNLSNYYNNRLYNPIMNDYSRNTQYDKYPNKNNFSYDFKEIEKEKKTLEDKISNGGYPNTKIVEGKITKNIIEEKNPLSDGDSKKINDYLNNIKNEVDKFKNNESNIKNYKDKINELNHKIDEIDTNLSSLEEKSQNNKKLFDYLQEKEKNVDDKYKDLEEKFNELQKNLSSVKEEKNKTGIMLMNSIIDNNKYQEELLNQENKINRFINEQNNNLNINISKLNEMFNDKAKSNDIETEQIKKKINDLQNEVKEYNNKFIIVNEFPNIENKINELKYKAKHMINKINGISNNQEDTKIKNGELNVSVKFEGNNMDEINKILNENENNIAYINENYVIKDEIVNINNKITEIRTKIKKIYAKNKNNNVNINKLNSEDDNLNLDYKDMVTKEYFKNESIKKDNEYKQFQNNYYITLNQIQNNYKDLNIKFGEFDNQEINKISNLKEIINKIAKKVIDNKNELDTLKNQDEKIYTNFEQIKTKFKAIDSNIVKIKGLEKNNLNNKLKLDDINNKILKLEKVINGNEDKKNDLQKDNLNSFNNKINERNELDDLVIDNNENSLVLQINELNQKEKENKEILENKLNDFKNEQNKINQKNKKEIETISTILKEEINKFGNIKRSVGENINNPEIHKKIISLEKQLESLKEYSDKMEILIENNNKEIKEKLKLINDWISNFANNANQRLNQLENFSNEKLEEIKHNQSNINMKGEHKFHNKSSVNYYE